MMSFDDACAITTVLCIIGGIIAGGIIEPLIFYIIAGMIGLCIAFFGTSWIIMKVYNWWSEG